MDAKYHFTHLKSKKFAILKDKTALDYLNKWSMKGQLKLTAFCFNEPFQIYHKTELVSSFFHDPVVLGRLNALCPTWLLSADTIHSFDVEQVPCRQLSMSFFDKMADPNNGVVRNKRGDLQHCVDDMMDGFMVSDELRRLLLDEESEQYSHYNEEERDELLFRLLGHLALGGKWCQFEDNLLPYLDLTKMLYKDVVRVERHPETNQLHIRTLCLKIKVLNARGVCLAPGDICQVQNFLYLLVDPVDRQLVVLAHEFGGQFE